MFAALGQGRVAMGPTTIGEHDAHSFKTGVRLRHRWVFTGMSWFLQWEEELGKLDELLAKAPCRSPESEVAQEHGSMPAECELDLKLARTAIGRIADVDTLRAAQKIVVSLPSNRRS